MYRASRKKRARACGEHTWMSVEWLMRITKGKFTVPSRANWELRREGKIYVQVFPNLTICSVGKSEKLFPSRQAQRRKIVFHMATHITMRYRRREQWPVHMLRSNYNGSWGTDLWPLCRVSPFNNQWSLRGNSPFSFFHIFLLIVLFVFHFAPSTWPLSYKNVLFTAPTVSNFPIWIGCANGLKGAILLLIRISFLPSDLMGTLSRKSLPGMLQVSNNCSIQLRLWFVHDAQMELLLKFSPKLFQVWKFFSIVHSFFVQKFFH